MADSQDKSSDTYFNDHDYDDPPFFDFGAFDKACEKAGANALPAALGVDTPQPLQPFDTDPPYSTTLCPTHADKSLSSSPAALRLDTPQPPQAVDTESTRSTTPDDHSQQQVQPSRNDDEANDELKKVNLEIKSLKLQLKLNELEKRRHSLIQKSSHSKRHSPSKPDDPVLGQLADNVPPILEEGIRGSDVRNGRRSSQSTEFRLADTDISQYPGTSFDVSGRDNSLVLHSGFGGHISVPGTDPQMLSPIDLGVGVLARPPHAAFQAQFNERYVDPSRLNLAPLPEHGIAGNFQTENSDELVMPSLSPGPLRDQALGQQASRLPLSQPCTTQAISVAFSHPVAQAQQSNRPTRRDVTRKRPRSPDLKQQRLSAAYEELSKHARQTGVPQDAVGVLCFSFNSPAKRSRTAAEKQDKKEIENAGGSCFLCLVSKKKCSRDRPCDHCKSYWGERVASSTSFKWTCDVVIKLTDFKIFWTLPENFLIPQELHLTSKPYSRNIVSNMVRVIRPDVEHLLDLLDCIEPYRLSRRRRGGGPRNKLDACLKLLGIFRWKDVLHYLSPELHSVLKLFETASKIICLYLFGHCEGIRKRSLDGFRLTPMIALLEEMGYFQSMDIYGSSSEQVRSILTSRLRVFCTRLYDFPIKRPFARWPEHVRTLTFVLEAAGEASTCLPPHALKCLPRPILPIEWHMWQVLAHKFPETPYCLLSRLNGSQEVPDSPRDNDCCCGWIIETITPSVLKFFDHTPESFARKFHAEGWPVDVLGSEMQVFAPQLIEFIARVSSSWSVKEKLILLGHALRFTLNKSFEILRAIINEATITIPEDKLSFNACSLRQQVLSIILNTATIFWHVFWDTEDEHQHKPKSAKALIIQFTSWLSNSSESEKCIEFMLEYLKFIVITQATTTFS